MNKKGFTLIELLGVIVILSIIMLIAIPNVVSTLEKSKKDTYIADAKKLVSLVQYEIRKGNVTKPTATTTTTVELGELSTDQIVRDPDGNPYSLNGSYVIVKVENGYLVYIVQLIAKVGSTYRGIVETNVENLDGDDRYTYYSNSV